MKHIRGRRIPPTRFERLFWTRFPTLLMDDPDEDEHNELIRKLRNVAIEYFKELEIESNKQN